MEEDLEEDPEEALEEEDSRTIEDEANLGDTTPTETERIKETGKDYPLNTRNQKKRKNLK